jgi:hypothetical protein
MRTPSKKLSDQAWRARNRDKDHAYGAKYRANNREKELARHAKRRHAEKLLDSLYRLDNSPKKPAKKSKS